MMWRRRLGADGRSSPCRPGDHPARLRDCASVCKSHVAPSRVASTSIPAYMEVDAGSSPNWQPQPEEHLPQTPGLMRRSSSAAACLCSHVHAHPNYRSLEATRVQHDVSAQRSRYVTQRAAYKYLPLLVSKMYVKLVGGGGPWFYFS